MSVLAMLSTVQLSGVVHFVTEVVQLVAVGHHDDAGDEDESDPSHECPPGCPSCHHVHLGGASLQPRAAEIVTRARAEEVFKAAWFVSDSFAPNPALAPLYRPPRA